MSAPMKLLLLVSIVLLTLWIFDPVVQLFDQSRISILNNREHYDISDELSEEKRKTHIDLSVIFPAYNEENRLIGTVDSALSFLLEWTAVRGWTFEVIVVDDGSSDFTTTLAKRYIGMYSDIFRVITLRQNQGKGGAVKVGVQEARGKYVLMADADGATEIGDLDRLVNEMEKMEAQHTSNKSKKEVGLVVGSRAHLAEKSVATRAFHRTVLMKGFHFLVMMLCTRQIQDTQCGFKLFTRNIARKLFGNLHLYRWAFDIELVYQAEALGIEMKEVAVNWKEIEGSKLIRNKFDVVTTSLTMARDMLAVRLAYLLGIWKLPSAVNHSFQTSEL